MNIGEQPAFPVNKSLASYGDNGMTLRQYYAGQAITGFNINRHVVWHDDDHKAAAQWCVAMADALIAELEKTK